MTYEIEQALNRKTNEWEFRSVQQEVERLKHEVLNKQQNIDELTNRIASFNHCLNGLIDAIMANSPDENLQQEVFELKQYL